LTTYSYNNEPFYLHLFGFSLKEFSPGYHNGLLGTYLGAKGTAGTEFLIDPYPVIIDIEGRAGNFIHTVTMIFASLAYIKGPTL